MALPSWLVGLFKREQSALPSPDATPTRESVSGTRWVGRRPVATERNPEFATPGDWAWVAQQMPREDPKLSGVSMMTHNALSSATWSVEAGGDSAEAERNAEYVRQMLGLENRGCMMTRAATFEESLNPMWNYLDVGFRTLEEGYYFDEATDRLWLSGWLDMSPDTVRGWILDDDEQLAQIIQMPRSGYSLARFGERVVDASRALVLTHKLTGTAFEGTGLLRPCWRWLQSKQHNQDQLDTGSEKWAQPGLKVKTSRLPADVIPYEPHEISAMRDEAVQSCAEYAAGPGMVVQASDAVDVETFGEGAYDSSHILANINQSNQEMATAYLAHFIELGLGDVGSRATGQVHWNAWRQSMVNALDYIGGMICGPSGPGRGTTTRMVELNFYPAGVRCPPSERPVLVHTGLDVDGFADLLPHIPALVAADALTPDDQIERRIRRLGTLGATPERGERAPAEPAPSGNRGGRPSEGPSEEVQT